MCTLEEKEKESKMRTQTVRYRVYEEWITHPQLGRYCCYGIVCESYLPKHGWQLQQAVSDITDDRNAAEALAALMQQEDLEPCHLLDVVEDYLNGMKAIPKERRHPQVRCRDGVFLFTLCNAQVPAAGYDVSHRQRPYRALAQA